MKKCIYDPQCTRLNPQHFKEELHPIQYPQQKENSNYKDIEKDIKKWHEEKKELVLELKKKMNLTPSPIKKSNFSINSSPDNSPKKSNTNSSPNSSPNKLLNNTNIINTTNTNNNVKTEINNSPTKNKKSNDQEEKSNFLKRNNIKKEENNNIKTKEEKEILDDKIVISNLTSNITKEYLENLFKNVGGKIKNIHITLPKGNFHYNNYI
jgi:hypothetical protein